MANYNKKNRERSLGRNTFWIFGYHAVAAVLKNPNRTINEFLAVKSSAGEFSKYSPRIVGREEIDKILPTGAIHQGLAVNVNRSDYCIEDILEKTENQKTSTIVILDQVSDIHNVGAILRSSAAFDVDAVLIPQNNAPNENGQMAKSACGALEVVPLVQVTNIAQAIEKLKKRGYWCVGLDAHTDKTMDEFEFPEKTVFIFGSEGEGMRKLTKDSCDYLVKLAMSDNMESLNLSNATAITLYQRYIKNIGKK